MLLVGTALCSSSLSVRIDDLGIICSFLQSQQDYLGSTTACLLESVDCWKYTNLLLWVPIIVEPTKVALLPLWPWLVLRVIYLGINKDRQIDFFCF